MFMEFKHLSEKGRYEGLGSTVGYIASYFVFTTVLFFVLTYVGKLPETWTYFHIMAIVLLIAGIGYSLKRWIG